jgi:hypothetical protein
MRGHVATIMLTLALALAGAIALPGTEAHAAPAREAASSEAEPEHVIPPGREQAARELLAPALEATPTGSSWLGPTIELDRIKWWLMRDDQARAILMLIPRELAGADDPLSQSFAIQIAWAPEVEPDPQERESIARAIEAIQAGDHGQFYIVRREAFAKQPPYLTGTAADPASVHRRWGLSLAGVALLGLLATLVTLRRPRQSVD